MRAIILAAGLGTRLRPLTDFLPKPLLPVAGVPNIVRIIRHLVRNGIFDIGINLHHLPEAIPTALGPGDGFGVRLRYYREDEILGTGGGIRRIMMDAPHEAHLVINGDVLFAPDIEPVVAFHNKTHALATMVVRPSAEAETLGAVGVDDSGRVRRLVYGGDTNFSPLQMFTGVHVLSPDILLRLPENGCIVRKTYIPMVNENENLRACSSNAPFWDLGTPKSLLQASTGLLCGRIALSGYEAPQNRFFVGRNVTFTGRPIIKDGACICDGAQVVGDIEIEDAIVLEGAIVSQNTKGVIVCPDGTVVTP